VIGQRLAAFLTATAHWTVTYYGGDIVGKSILSVRCGIALQRMEVCAISLIADNFTECMECVKRFVAFGSHLYRINCLYAALAVLEYSSAATKQRTSKNGCR